ncbi:hypothetical protein DFH08DRAFT_809785 [Mycena albidolilacea]|uniref:Uncharacterized protein n=1 Tax=Mycena albidolilacea TaxID=1033008 RepID=A0AAD7A0H5_9AGAR|nr:hypothetical protein DFH08DRAFT_809785 [Mycena albidolilacea]
MVTRLPLYKENVEVICWFKKIPALTNIEKNLVVRGPGTENFILLDLSPLHCALHNHIQSILNIIDLIFGPNMLLATATPDGKPWFKPEVMEEVFKLIPSLPHIKKMSLAFFHRALVTWVCFSVEFAPSSLIDLCTATEHQQAWMPLTNNTNEGCLGGYHVATSHLKYKADKLNALKVAHKWYCVNDNPTVLPEMPMVVLQVVED